MQVVLSMGLAFIFTFPVAFIYRHVQKSHNYSPAFLRSLFIFSWTASILTLVIGNNLVKAIGLVGAISVVRFRNALKSPYDAVYILWTLAIGVSCGSGYFMVAAILVGMGSLFEIVLHILNFGAQKTFESVVKVELPEARERELLERVHVELKKFGKGYRKVNTVFSTDKAGKVHVFMVQARTNQRIDDLKQALASLEGVGQISYIESNSPLFAA